MASPWESCVSCYKMGVVQRKGVSNNHFDRRDEIWISATLWNLLMASVTIIGLDTGFFLELLSGSNQMICRLKHISKVLDLDTLNEGFLGISISTTRLAPISLIIFSASAIQSIALSISWTRFWYSVISDSFTVLNSAYGISPPKNITQDTWLTAPEGAASK